jgi:O-antigen/teichoic acid export membrane protein
MAEHVKTLFKGASIFFVGLLISKVFTYIYRLIIARGMGPETYGIFSLCFAIISVVSALAIFGLPNAIERYVPYHINDKPKVKGIILFALQVGCISSIIAVVLLYLLSGTLAQLFKNEAILEPLKVFTFSIFPLFVITIYNSISKAFKKIEYQVYAYNIIYSIVNVSAAAIAIIFSFGIMGLAYGFLAATIAAAIALFILIERTKFTLFDKIIPTFIRKEIASFSWPLVLVGMFGLIIGYTDTILLGYFMNETFVGLYNSAIPTANLLLVVPLSVISMLVPTTAELLSREKLNDVKHSYLITTEWIFLVNFPLFLIFLLFPQQILEVLFGSAYSTAGLSLTVLSLGFFIYSIAQPALKMMELTNKTKFLAVITASAAVLNVALNIILIPIFGINGAAIASAVSFIGLFVITFFKVNVIEKYPLFSSNFIKAGAVAIVLLLGIYFASKFVFKIVTPILLIPLVCIYLGLYAMIIYLFILRKEEKEFIGALISRIRTVILSH